MSCCCRIGIGLLGLSCLGCNCPGCNCPGCNPDCNNRRRNSDHFPRTSYQRTLCLAPPSPSWLKPVSPSFCRRCNCRPRAGRTLSRHQLVSSFCHSPRLSGGQTLCCLLQEPVLLLVQELMHRVHPTRPQ